MRDLARRILRLEAGDGPGLEPQLIVIRGGLPDTALLHASIGRYHRVYAQPHETEGQFADRCLDLAAALGEQFAVLGGLPDDPVAEDDFPGC